MANADTPFGLRPVRNAYSGGYNGGIRTYCIAAGDGTATFVGDPVKLAGTAEIVDGVTYSNVVQGTAAATVVGVVVGFAPNPDNLSSNYRLASTRRLVYVCDDPNQLFEIQEVSGGTPLTANDIGLNANFAVGTGSTTSGYSGVELNNATEATTNTLDLKIIGLAPRADNEVGEHAKWLVRLNNHALANQVAGV